MNTLSNRINGINEILAGAGAPFEVIRHSVFKPDGLHEGIGFKSDAFNATPILYMNAGIEEMDDFALAGYLQTFFQMHAKNIPTESFAEHENILDEILPRLCSAKHLEAMKYQDIAFVTFLDMVVYFYLPLPVNVNDDCQGGIQVTNTILNNACITVDEAFEASRSNIAETYKIQNLTELIVEMAGADINIEDAKIPMWVATTKTLHNGAAVILCEDVLLELQKKLGTFYICPSSTHEVICVSDKDVTASELTEIVRFVNTTEVPDEDVLSNTVYICKNGIIGIAAK